MNMQDTLSFCCSLPDAEGAQVHWPLMCRVQMHEKMDLSKKIWDSSLHWCFPSGLRSFPLVTWDHTME